MLKLFGKILVGTISFLSLIGIGLAIYLSVDFGAEDSVQVDSHIINDVTQLNPIKVDRVVAPTNIDQIIEAIKTSSGSISIGGGRYSQGGQTAIENSLHLDMRQFNQVLDLDVAAKQITVQSGIRWRDLQSVIDKHNLAVKIMQSYANFTVGGSLSVNVHGRYIGEGPIIRSIEAFTLVTAQGEVITATPTHNSEWFYAVIGGYGGLGVIADVTLNLVDNVKVKRFSQTMAVSDYKSYFFEKIRNNADIVFHNANIQPPFFTDVRSVSWQQTEEALTQQQRLVAKNKQYTWQPKLADLVASSDFGKWLRHQVVEPLFYSFDAVQWRNYEASYDVNELEPVSRADHTYALREYFVPIESLDSFVSKMTSIFNQYDVNVLNVSIRHALPDTGSLLAWAPTEVFAFVIYYRQGTDTVAKTQVKQWSQAMIDAVITEGGAYYLPYQLHATTEQFLAAYPKASQFFEFKQRVDPNYRFRNKLWQQHYAKFRTDN